MGENQAVMDENQALREENQALRESNARGGAIRKKPAPQDATDEAVQVNFTRYLKGASDREGGKGAAQLRDPQPTP
ncbi:hypothetical protein DPEC_G00034630 [Dallia pectoralis]|uniref:Uncharacterized protein n=2 Tax=Dallia pectoralis TaxID=75939 RepID=A0ACC2HD33_DALPE|nr:hypothetical protein DPEC_G00034620 [Dallia pectoralis]KAJ8013900.1 hypothetical protein DPEC_G00034630 [Dallia pectoralis]